MPLSGAGIYTAPASSWNPAVDTTDINSTDWIALLADLTTALSTAMYKDGQAVATANINFAQGISVATNKFTVDTSGNTVLAGALTLAAAGAFASPFAKVGSFTRVTNAVDAGVGYTGVGFKPSAIIFVTNIDSTPTFGIGFDDGTTRKCFYYNTNNSAVFVPTASIRIEDAAGANFESGVIAAFDADGFTITWTKTGTPAGATANIAYMAFR